MSDIPQRYRPLEPASQRPRSDFFRAVKSMGRRRSIRSNKTVITVRWRTAATPGIRWRAPLERCDDFVEYRDFAAASTAVPSGRRWVPPPVARLPLCHGHRDVRDVSRRRRPEPDPDVPAVMAVDVLGPSMPAGARG